MVNLATIIFKMGNQMLNNDSDDDNHDDKDQDDDDDDDVDDDDDDDDDDKAIDNKLKMPQTVLNKTRVKTLVRAFVHVALK